MGLLKHKIYKYIDQYIIFYQSILPILTFLTKVLKGSYRIEANILFIFFFRFLYVFVSVCFLICPKCIWVFL